MSHRRTHPFLHWYPFSLERFEQIPYDGEGTSLYLDSEWWGTCLSLVNVKTYRWDARTTNVRAFLDHARFSVLLQCAGCERVWRSHSFRFIKNVYLCRTPDLRPGTDWMKAILWMERAFRSEGRTSCPHALRFPPVDHLLDAVARRWQTGIPFTEGKEQLLCLPFGVKKLTPELLEYLWSCCINPNVLVNCLTKKRHILAYSEMASPLDFYDAQKKMQICIYGPRLEVVSLLKKDYAPNFNELCNPLLPGDVHV